jgi:protoporphyrinogen oxidase
MSEICIIGTGMAGYGAASRLMAAGRRPLLFDRRSYAGGHTASHVYEGKYTFDEGPHISFTKNERIAKLLSDSIDGSYETVAAKVDNYWQGHFIKHPAQINLHGLPTDLVVKILEDFVAAQHTEHGRIENYGQWLRASFGATFAETFPMQYGLKYHTTEADNMNTEWIGPRLYRARLDEVLRGALAPATNDVHYVTTFRYPSRGGFGAYLERFMGGANVQLNQRLSGVDPKARQLRFASGALVPYEQLISSMPLPELVPIIDGVPREVLEAAQRLACTELVLVNLVVNRSDLHDAHWTYFYDSDISFTRLSTPHLQSAHNVPPGCASFQAECYFSKKYRPLTGKPDDFIDPVIRDLRRCGLLREDDEILFRNAMHVEYANVIFDLECRPALDIVHGYLDELGIRFCGRYGDWAYIWTDEAFLSGERAAERAMRAI